MPNSQSIFITGGTGYMGRPLIEILLKRGHRVDALVRPGSEGKLPSGSRVVIGDALDSASYGNQVRSEHTFVQLVGVPHPGPHKADLFRKIDLVAGREAVRAAQAAGIHHFVYLSVAHTTSAMKAYVQVRQEVEAQIQSSRLNATMLRPWYVLGPGHRWPLLLLPAYWVMELFPSTRDTARLLGLVTRRQMLAALVQAVEDPPHGIRIWDVPKIKKLSTIET